MPRPEEFDNLRDSIDSLDKIEHVMALGDKVIDEINADPRLTDVEAVV